jgi:hypothetical protein
MGWLWPFPQILRPDWKGFLRTNALAYWASSSRTKEKSFITLTPGLQGIPGKPGEHALSNSFKQAAIRFCYKRADL